MGLVIVASSPFLGALWVWSPLPASLPWFPAGLVTVAGTPPLDPYGFGHRCDSTSLGSLLVWSPLLAPLPCFPVGLVTVARLLSLGSLWRWSPLLVPHPLFPMGLVTVTSPPPLVPHGLGQHYQLRFLPHEFFYPFADLKG